jgi:hypothetical protein
MRTFHNVKDNGMLQLMPFRMVRQQTIAWSGGSFIQKNNNIKVTRKINRKITKEA